MRTLIITLSLLALALAAAWRLGALAPLMPAMRSTATAVLGAPTSDGTRPGAGTGSGGLRKCVAGERVLYTDAACPPGYSSATVQGQVNVVAPVVPASVPAARPAPGAAAEGTLREQMIDRAVNR